MGDCNVTIQNLRVVKTDPEKGIILIKGAVPGAKGGWVTLKDAIKKKLPDNIPFPTADEKKTESTINNLSINNPETSMSNQSDNESIIENLLKQRFELLGDNFIVQHSDARIIDQLVYKWLDFKSIYIKVMVEKYQKLLSLGYKIKATDLESKINFHFEEMPKKNIRLK